ncbi:hypothetical protein D3C72_1761280 [compost metagenome]
MRRLCIIIVAATVASCDSFPNSIENSTDIAMSVRIDSADGSCTTTLPIILESREHILLRCKPADIKAVEYELIDSKCTLDADDLKRAFSDEQSTLRLESC